MIGAILVNRAPGRIEPRGFRIESAKLVRAWRARIATGATFLIGILFIILSARISPEEIGDLGWVSIGFVAVLVVVARPLAVALSALGSSLKNNERAFIAWMAPRGIVAAATSSTFALGLSDGGVGGGPERPDIPHAADKARPADVGRARSPDDRPSAFRGSANLCVTQSHGGGRGSHDPAGAARKRTAGTVTDGP